MLGIKFYELLDLSYFSKKNYLLLNTYYLLDGSFPMQ